MTDTASDPRWIFLQQEEWTCASCDQAHRGLPDMAFARPAGDVFQQMDLLDNSAFTPAGDILTEDLCRCDGHFYVRALLSVPILGTDDRFSFGVWSTLAAQSFDQYLAGFNDGNYDLAADPWFSWLANTLPMDPKGNDGIKCSLRPQPDRQRPEVLIEDADHPLYSVQRNGATLDQILDILATCGHDIRPSLPNNGLPLNKTVKHDDRHDDRSNKNSADNRRFAWFWRRRS